MIKPISIIVGAAVIWVASRLLLRRDANDAWHENVFKNEYPKQYKDFEGLNK
ncbi:hypothetical protein ACTFOF_25745 [Bacillus cereus group sp. MYBK87-2]